MKVAYLTTDEPFYLPREFAYLFEHARAGDELLVLIVPPEHRVGPPDQRRDVPVARRVLQSFGLRETAYLAGKAIALKLIDRLPRALGGRAVSVASVCRDHGVTCRRVASVNDPSTHDLLRDWGAQLLVSVSCPQLFRKALIELAPHGCLNLHCSPLPDYRGLFPAFWMLLHDEPNPAATLFFVNERIDGGDILLQRPVPVQPRDTLETFLRRSKRVGSELILEGIEQVRRGDRRTRPIEPGAGSYYSWPTAADVRQFRRKRRLR